MNKIKPLVISVLMSSTLCAQEDSTYVEEEFDFSAFELAAEPAKAFCNNKVLGQSPTTLVGAFYDFIPEHALTAGSPVANENVDISDRAAIQRNQGLELTTNLPIISKNNILINFNLIFQRQFYNIEGANGHPLLQTLNENGLTRMGSLFTVFKPLNEKNFLLGQFGFEINGDYPLNNIQTSNALRLPAALLYGWKPNDRLMYAFGISRTYLGGSLNYVPIIYYYHTFMNQKWGIEAVVPSRAALRYRFDSKSLLKAGFNVIGATYALNDWSGNAEAYAPGVDELFAAQAVELRRSEIRTGFTYQRQLFGFFWLSAEVGYRVNYNFELDQEGDFLRFFGNDEPYFIENDLANQMYFNIGITYTSP
jgi:hypothetical protein